MTPVERLFYRTQKLIYRALERTGAIDQAQWQRWHRQQLLLQDLPHVRSLWAEIDVLGKPFFFDPLRTGYAELMGDAGLNRMVARDCYGLASLRVNAPVVLDIGSHIGLFPRVVEQRFPAARILSLEPDRHNFALLARNNALLANAQSFQLGVYDSNSRLTLRESDVNSWRSTLSVNDAFFSQSQLGNDSFSHASYEVDVVTVDHFVSEQALTQVDFVGITVPGEIELAILRGAERTLTEYRPLLALSVYPGQVSAVNEWLASRSYSLLQSPFGQFQVFGYAEGR